MAARGISNYGPYFRGKAHPIGIGAANKSIANVGWMGFMGREAGDVVYLPVDSAAYAKDIQMGVFFQAVGGSVTVSYTMQNPGLSCDPDPQVQATVAWVSPQTVAPGAIVPATYNMFAAIKIEFAGPAEIYVGSR